MYMESLNIIDMNSLDKTKEHETHHVGYTIVMFWQPQTKQLNAGWAYKIKTV